MGVTYVTVRVGNRQTPSCRSGELPCRFGRRLFARGRSLKRLRIQPHSTHGFVRADALRIRRTALQTNRTTAGPQLRHFVTTGSQGRQTAKAVAWLKQNFVEALKGDDLVDRAHMDTLNVNVVTTRTSRVATSA